MVLMAKINKTVYSIHSMRATFVLNNSKIRCAHRNAMQCNLMQRNKIQRNDRRTTPYLCGHITHNNDR